jgi:hypothetical protein
VQSRLREVWFVKVSQSTPLKGLQLLIGTLIGWHRFFFKWFDILLDRWTAPNNLQPTAKGRWKTRVPSASTTAKILFRGAWDRNPPRTEWVKLSRHISMRIYFLFRQSMVKCLMCDLFSVFNKGIRIDGKYLSRSSFTISFNSFFEILLRFA